MEMQLLGKARGRDASSKAGALGRETSLLKYDSW